MDSQRTTILDGELGQKWGGGKRTGDKTETVRGCGMGKL